MAIALLFGAERAQAATFTVNSTSTAPDDVINGTCDADATADVDCTLTATVEEANNTTAADTINFSASDSPSDPNDLSFPAQAGAGGAIIAVAPPTITHALTVDGGDCDPSALTSPCLRVATAWEIDTDGEVLIRGLAFVGPSTGIRVIEATGTDSSIPDFQLYATWFGVDTLGAPGGGSSDPAIGVELEKISGARIGSGFSTDRNFFSRYTTGLDINGADNTEVFGNVFGTLPDGSFARTGESQPNSDGIEITGNSVPNPDDESTGTEIGASSAAAVATPACDSGCNDFSGAGAPGVGNPGIASAIDLTTETGEIPASDVAILGNDVGETGSNIRGITIGDADDVRIGGPAAGDGDRNLIGNNEITSTAGATGILIQNNDVESTESAPPIDLKGSGQVLDNRMRTQGSQASIRLSDTSGPGYVVQGNILGELGAFLGLAAVGIDLTATADGNLIGGTGAGDGNVIAGVALSRGIRIAGDGNQVFGNQLGIRTNGTAGPLITGIDLQTDADDNVIGGTTAASENLISNIDSGATILPGNAIQVAGAASDGNQILRNRGANNEGLFIDLGGDGNAGNLAEPNGPNGGAQAPAIGALTQTSASGTTAPGASVMVFSKASDDPGELAGFVAETTADGSGAWTVTLPTQPVGQRLAATATTVAAGTSELSATATVPAPPQPPPPGDTDPPETRIDKGPKKKSAKRKAKFQFSADESGATFACKLDKKATKPCSSPLKVKRLKRGKHKLTVTATDAAGNTDPTPAVHKFKVKKKR